MIKKFLLALGVTGTLCLCADILKLDHSFTKVNKQKLLLEWNLHSWSGFRPAAKLTLIPSGTGNGNILRISRVTSRYGMLLVNQTMFAGKSFDMVFLKVRMRGNGVAAFCLHLFTADKKWNGPSRTWNIPLTREWKTHSLQIPLTNGFAGKTNFFRICAGAGYHTEMEIMHIEAVPERVAEMKKTAVR